MKRNDYLNDPAILFLLSEEKRIHSEISELKNELNHVKKLTKKRQFSLSEGQIGSISPIDNAWNGIHEILLNAHSEFTLGSRSKAGLTNQGLHEQLKFRSLNIREATFRGYLSRFKNQNKIEKKGGRNYWTLVNGDD